MSIHYDELSTPQDWIDAGRTIVATARDAAKTTDRKKWQSAADDCAEFVDQRTLDCPKEIVHIVSGAQVELSQLIVANDIGSIKSRGAQFEAYLLDIDHLAADAEKSADALRLTSVTKIATDVTGVLDDLKTVKGELKKNDIDLDAALASIEEFIGRLAQVRDDVEGLAGE